MYENLIKPVENGQFEGASTSAQWLNLKKKRSRCHGQWPNLKKKEVAAFPGLGSQKKRDRHLAGPWISKKK